MSSAMTGTSEENERLETNAIDGLDIEIEYGRNNNKDGTLFGRRAEDVVYRHRFLHTACVGFSVFALGWRNALIGPTLPDLRLIIDEDLSTASWIFTAKSLGGIIGSVCGGFAYDRFNRIGVFISLVFCMGIVAGVTPWCYNFAAMFVVHVLHGVFATALETAATADVAVLWKQKTGLFMQAVQFAFSVGAIISPLLCEPFLAEQITTNRITLNSSGETSSQMQLLTPRVMDNDVNDTSEQTGKVYNTTLPIITYGDTRIFIPYSMVSFVCLLSSCLYLLISFIYGNVYRTCQNTYYPGSNRNISRKKYFLNRKMKIFFTLLLALTQLFYVVSEHCFIGFLMTFVVSELKWSKANGSTASSSFWIAFATGRLSGIVIVKFINLSAVIITFSLILTSGALLLLLAVVFGKHVLVWISIVVIGYGMSVIFSSLFSWLSQNIRTLTGKMTSIFFIFMCIGNMVGPTVVGYLMDNISEMWFIYSCLALVGCMCTCFIFALVLYNQLKKVSGSSKSSVTVSE